MSTETLDRLDAFAEPGRSRDEVIAGSLDVYETEAASIHTPDEGA